MTKLSRWFISASCLLATPVLARDVKGAFKTTFIADDGSRVTRSAPLPPGSVVSVLVRDDDAPGGYFNSPGTLAADGSFVIPGVPDGRYFLVVDQGNGPIFYELSTSTPDLTNLVSQRADLSFETRDTPVLLDVQNLEPWTVGGLFTGDLFQINSSQAGVDDSRPFRNNGRPPAPAPGANSFHGKIQWAFRPGGSPDLGLPDASRHDVLFFHQNPQRTHGSGNAALAERHATRFARLDDVTIPDGGPASISMVLKDAPQTGKVRADIRWSRYQSIAAQISPGASLSFWAFDVFGWPHSVQFPQPQGAAPVLILFGKDFARVNGSVPDTDYGTLAYGEFLDRPLWKKLRQVSVSYDVSVAAPGAITPAFTQAFLTTQSEETDDQSQRVLTPGIAPVAPRVNGADGFVAQSGVGLQPTLSWSRHGRGDDDGGSEERCEGECDDDGGVAYTVNIAQLGVDTAGNAFVSAFVLTANTFERSFKVPPGYLTPGSSYFAVITVMEAPWMKLDVGPFLAGPFRSVDAVTAAFTP